MDQNASPHRFPSRRSGGFFAFRSFAVLFCAAVVFGLAFADAAMAANRVSYRVDFPAGTTSSARARLVCDTGGSCDYTSSWTADGGTINRYTSLTCTYYFEFLDVAGYCAPGPTNPFVGVPANNKATQTVVMPTYTTAATKFTIDLLPAGAVSAGARWAIVRTGACGSWTSAWTTSGGTVTAPNICTPCDYAVVFNTVAGYCPPDSISLSGYSPSATTYDLGSATYSVSGTSFTLTLATSPAGPPPTGAQWRIVRQAAGSCTAWTSGWAASGAVITDSSGGCGASACSYAVEFAAVSGYDAPPDIPAATYTGGATNPLGTFAYTPNMVKFTATLAPAEALAAGVQWRINRISLGACSAVTSAWVNSGDTVTFADATGASGPCEYYMEFTPIAGWTSPTAVDAVFAPSATTYNLGTFTYQLPSGPFCDDFNHAGIDPRWMWVDRTASPASPAYRTPTGGVSMVVGARGTSTWTGADQYASLYENDVSGDFEAVVKITSDNVTAEYGKAGIVVRNNMATASGGYIFVGVVDYHGFGVYYDASNNGYLDTNQVTGGTVTFPCWIKVRKVGTTFTGFYSGNGTTFIQIGSAVTPGGTAGTQDVGMFVSSYNAGVYKIVNYDDFCVTLPGATTNFTCHVLPIDVRPTARWRLYNNTTGAYQTDWLASDVVVAIPAHNYYKVEWNLVDGWASPADVPNVQIPDALGCTDSCTMNGIYTSLATTTTTTTTTTTSTTTTLPTTTSSTTAPASLCVDLSDKPLDAQLNAAPANIMFVLDDSGSMDWEFMTSEDQGMFSGEYYLWTMPDDAYSGSLLTDKGKWRSQWSGYNQIYYNPVVDYVPWPTMADASTTAPLSNPASSTSGTLDPMATYTTIDVGWVVDDSQSGFTHGGTSISSYSSSSGYLGNYHATTNNSGGNGAQWGQWTPVNMPAGTYNVYARWVASTDRTVNAVYTINASGLNFTTQAYSQQSNNATWIQLQGVEGFGNYVFDGTGGFARIDHTVSSYYTDKVVYDAVKFVPVGVNPTITVRNAHYYVWSDANSTMYLVNFEDGDLKYYRFGNPAADDTGQAGIMEDTSPPDDVIPKDANGNVMSYSDALQNWCNWFSFYRRRILTAKAAVSRTVSQLQGVNVGFYSIWGRLVKPCQAVKVKSGGTMVDNTASLLSALYSSSYRASGSTPLRTALITVGKYYTEGQTTSIGSWPYANAASGGACQQSFCVAMTDGLWNDSFSGLGNVDAASTDWSGYAPYKDSWSDTLADVAMKYYAYDLSTTLQNLVPTNFQDKATFQHMVTYTVSIGQYGTLNPADYDLTNTNESLRVYPTWPQPVADSLTAIDDLWHAAVNGRGRFLTAGNPSELVDSLMAIAQNIISRIGSGASVAINGEELYAGTILFQSSYAADTWTGDVKAYHVDSSSGAVLTESPVWSAAAQLEATNWDTGRRIVTYNGFNGTPFRYANLTSLQKYMLNPTDTTRQQQILNYVRGDQSLEVTQPGGIFRARVKKLSDIVHSSPLFLANMIFVGGDDGMFHCFDADTGKETFAYVPNGVFQNLSVLPLTTYTHMFYVDQTPTQGVVDGRQMVVCGYGKGGKGYFLLDVTSARSVATEAAAAGFVKWEYPSATTPGAEISGLGYSFSKAYIVKTHAGWGVIFGNGYASSDGTAKLYVVSVADGTLMKVIDTGVGSCNGLSTPLPVDKDGDGTVDYAFAGDLKGNLWKFNLTSSSASSWSVAYNAGGTPKPLFTAIGTDGAGQPITTRPDAMLHCKEGMPGMIVCFGTGKYVGDTDYTDSRTQTIYGVWDYGDDADPAEYLGSFVRGTNRLSNQPNTVTLLQQAVAASVSAGGRTAVVLTARIPVWATDPDATAGQNPNPSALTANNAGWYFDLPTSRERVVRDPAIRNKKFTVISAIPVNSPCTGGGSSVLYEMDPCTGGRTINPKKPTFDVNNDGLVNEGDFVVITDPDTGASVTADVTGLVYNGLLFPPSVLRDGDLERLYMGTAGGTIESQAESSARFGFFYWLEVQ